MKSAIFSSAIAIFATLASAVPTAAPTNIIARDQVKQVILSSAVVNVKEDTPNTPLGVTYKVIVSRANGMHGIRALVKFDFPDGLTGYKCKLDFAYPAQFSGTGEIQVFTIGDTNIENATWNKRPFRDLFKGTFRVTGLGEAVVLDASGLTFDCPAKGAKAYEVVSQGDSNEVVWYAPGGGLRIDVLQV